MGRRKLKLFRSKLATRIARFAGRQAIRLLKSRILLLFLGFCLLGFVVGWQTYPARGTFPDKELFEQMSVVSFRDSPSDSTSRFLVQLAAGGHVFAQYDVQARQFLPPSEGRPYGRTITATHYGPLRVRGHIGRGFWLDVPESPRQALLPAQFEELYRTTLGLVKPVSDFTGLLGTLSGYSVGYRIGSWNGSLRSHAVQKRVLATPSLGRTITREAWRRVLLEPMVMTGESDAARFAAISGTQRIYANFFRLALDDSDGFVPREVDRLTKLGRVAEARAMQAFVMASRRAAADSVHLADRDFAAIEGWGALLDRRGHWLAGAIPPPGEERIKLLGTLAWYGLAPPARQIDRVWVGPRMLVRADGAEGFVTDEIAATGVGCPISWRERLREESSGMGASAWLAERPEFAALGTFGRRIAHGMGRAAGQLATLWRVPRGEAGNGRDARRASPASRAGRAPSASPAGSSSGSHRDISFSFASLEGPTRLTLVGGDSAGCLEIARTVQATLARGDGQGPGSTAAGAPPVLDDSTTVALAAFPPDSQGVHREIVEGGAVDAVADSLRAHGVRDALLELPGNARAMGVSAGGDPWSIVIADPRGRGPGIARILLAPGQAISSAGRLGPGLIGASALAPDAKTAAAWNAALLGMDREKAIETARRRPDLSVILIEPATDGTDVIWIEADLKDRFVLDARTRMFRVEYF